MKDSNQLVELSDIQLQGARSLDGRIVVEANSAREGFELSWNIDQGSPLYHIYLYLSSDKTLSENDIRIFRDYVGSWDEKKVVCQFSPLNDFKCNDDRSEHLSEYFSNHGDMPWEGYLLIRFGDDRSNGVYFTRAVPLRLQY